ncbi:MAG TPA: hypothetical protein VGO47_10115, partial [Chlamydiales bacterium]|nr:hypothetical protein [Chlamydiales bacterium]
ACGCQFIVYSPLPEEQEKCPFVLIICSGPHTHPIPFPCKTPPQVERQVFEMLETLELDLTDATPRRVMRHPLIQMSLSRLLPEISNPTLIDLHPSLGNKDHLRMYISAIKYDKFPFGTDWAGMCSLI